MLPGVEKPVRAQLYAPVHVHMLVLALVYGTMWFGRRCYATLRGGRRLVRNNARRGTDSPICHRNFYDNGPSSDDHIARFT